MVSTSEAAAPGESTAIVRLPSLEKYEVIDRLDKGGMGSVYLAKLHGDTEICVVKLVHDEQLANETVRSRFLREAQIASELRHPKIARLTDAGRDDERLYLAMEYIVGKDMESMMLALMRQRKMLPPGLTLTVGADVLEGLHYAHGLSDSDGNHLAIVHRDLSPRNVMITYDGETKIIDFGLARTTLGEFRTVPGMVMGTLRYMSPEQAVAEPADRRSDIYTWGVVMYEALTGRPLVPDGEHRMILETVVNKTPAPLSSLNPSLPKELDAVLAKALEKNRDDRFDNAEEFHEALTKAAGKLCKTPRDHIGQFVYGMFPAGKKKAEEVFAKMAMVEPTSMRESPEFEATRAGIAGMAAADAPQVSVLGVSDSESTPYFEATSLAPATLPDSVASQVAFAESEPRKRSKLWLIISVCLMAAIIVLLIFYTNQTPPPLVVEPAPPAPSEPQVPTVAVNPTPGIKAVPEKAPPPPPIKKQRPPAQKGVRKAPPAKTKPKTNSKLSKAKNLHRQAIDASFGPMTTEEKKQTEAGIKSLMQNLEANDRSTIKKCLDREYGMPQSSYQNCTKLLIKALEKQR